MQYRFIGPDERERQMKKRVYPDSYFLIVDEQRLTQGSLARARFLLELDNATHSRNRFGREKVAPGLMYIKSAAYKARFGDNSGKWLVVTTGGTRMEHLMRRTEKVAKEQAGAFLFTTLDQLREGNVLTQPIWHQVGRSGTKPLFVVDPW